MVQGRLFISDETTLNMLSERYLDGWRFKATRVGRMEKELIIPPENDVRLHVGVISKAGVVRLFPADKSARVTPKEDDVLIMFEQSTATQPDTESTD